VAKWRGGDTLAPACRNLQRRRCPVKVKKLHFCGAANPFRRMAGPPGRRRECEAPHTGQVADVIRHSGAGDALKACSVDLSVPTSVSLGTAAPSEAFSFGATIAGFRLGVKAKEPPGEWHFQVAACGRKGPWGHFTIN
jgi:hypothetical protein